MKQAIYTALQSVQVWNKDHPRHGQAGAVMTPAPNENDEVNVRFDVDLKEEAVAIADLKTL
jgi:hypothetical protein